MSAPARYPETASLAREAYAASGCRTHAEFVALFDGAVGIRAFRAWIAGERPAAPLAALVLREVRAGWRPSGA